MRYKEYGNSKYCYLTHNRFKMFFNLISGKAVNVDIPNLLLTKFHSQELTEKSARTIGEMLIKLADIIKKEI